MRAIIDFLNMKTKEYELGCPSIPDEEWDRIYFELKKLEQETGLIYPDSPTQQISHIKVDELKKIEHEALMLSLDKTKDLDEISKFAEKEDSLLMTKLDGLSCELVYENGKLVKASTRGDGAIGEDVLHNALTISNVPIHIQYLKKLVVHGEVIITVSDFAETSGYKHSRNYAAGAIRLLNNRECKDRNIKFVAWEVVEGFSHCHLLSEKLEHLQNFGFSIVPYIKYNHTGIKQEDIDRIMALTEENDYPRDGAVIKYDLVDLKEMLGLTSHHFKNALAYKIEDEKYDTNLIKIDWTMGRTGILTPVAVFNPIEIDGTTVERASLHNLTIMKNLLGQPCVGQPLKIFKSNMIIPQVFSAEKDNCDNLFKIHIPDACPVCGGPVDCETLNESTNLVCTNPDCEGKIINKLDHFCSKKGLDIKGLSKATLEKLVDWGWLTSIKDIFYLKNYRDKWITEPGFGVKSVDKILNAIESAKQTTFVNFLSSLGIPLIGHTVAKDLFKQFKTYNAFREAVKEDFDFSELEGFAESKTNAILTYDYTTADEIVNLLTFIDTETDNSNSMIFEGINFVVTGKVTRVKNRSELQERIEARGGKVLSSISSKVHYLINNDINSTSAKNVKAKSLNIPIISEEEYFKMEESF